MFRKTLGSWRLELRCGILLVAVASAVTAAIAQGPSDGSAKYSPLGSRGVRADCGAHVQRTMELLAASTTRRQNTVRILFYGQSITEQDWWKLVVADLERAFPHARIIAENRAIGGFSSQLLVKTAEADVYPFYPDLVVLHAYGSHLEYENLIRGICSRTTAEVIVQTDHMAANDSLDEPTDPVGLTPQQWTPWMNAVFLPSMAEKYNLELADQRRLWKKYLRDNQLASSALLSDEVHLNDHGCELMSQIVGLSLQYRPELKGGDAKDRVRDYRLGTDVSWSDEGLTLEFDGNRVDAVLSSAGGEPVSVLIDGKSPASFPELYARTRVTPFPDTTWPCLTRVSNRTPPEEAEEWTLELHNVAPDMSTFGFSVRGSKTGPDGEGKNSERFVSKSGRVVIEPEDWTFDYARRVFNRSVSDGFQVKWRVIRQFTTQIASPTTLDANMETTVTIAQGLPPGRHTLQLIGTGPPSISVIRVYRPPLEGDSSKTTTSLHK